MKYTGKILFFILFFGAVQGLLAQCTPDQLLPYNGIFPAVLNPANVDQPYAQVIQYKAPVDTTAPFGSTTVAVKIDSIRITNVLGLPPGMSYSCNNNACMVNGGEVGCLIITGTCSAPGGYPLKVIVRTSARAIIAPPPVPGIPQVQVDTNERYGIFVNWSTGIANMYTPGKIDLYPNPAKHTINLEGDFTAQPAMCSIYSINGTLVKEVALSNQMLKHEVNIEGLPAGLYIVRVQNDQLITQKRLMIE